MTITPSLWIGISGLVLGCMLGFLVYRARLCTFGAMEDALIGRDWRRMKVFGFALAIAVIITQSLVLTDLLDPLRVTYLPSKLPLLGIVAGGVMFGVGMALVGTCGFGSLIRLGSGDLRSLVVLLVFALCAFAALRGVLVGLRIDVIESVTLAMPGQSRSDLATLFTRWSGVDLRISLTMAISAGLIWIGVRDRRLRRTPRLVIAGIALGLCVGLGWVATSLLADPFNVSQRPQSLTFVAPIARALFGVLMGHDSGLDFGVMSVIGVIIGALCASLYAQEFRWEAFDDDREMRRHMLGGALMGFGGVLAGGCTIGQGLSAGSLLAISMPIALISMMLGARLGIALIMGDITELWARLGQRE